MGPVLTTESLFGKIPLGDSSYRISRLYAFVVLNKMMLVVSPNKPEHVFSSLNPRDAFLPDGHMLQLHNAVQLISS